MNNTIIKLIENYINKANTLEELNTNTAIQKLIESTDDDTKKLINDMINKKFETISESDKNKEEVVEEDSEVEPDKDIKTNDDESINSESEEATNDDNGTEEVENDETQTTDTPKNNSKKIDVKLIILTGAMSLGIIGGSIVIANRKNNNKTTITETSSSQSTSANEENIDSLISETDTPNSDVSSTSKSINEPQTNISETIYHSDEDQGGTFEIDEMISRLEQQVDAAGIERVEVHTSPIDDRTSLRKTTSATLFDSGEARQIINGYDGDTTKIFNFMENWLVYYNDASEDCPIIHYADNLGIDMYSIQYELMQYNDWKDNCHYNDENSISYYDYLHEGYVNTNEIFPMSEVQAEKLEDLYASIFNAYYKENGIDAYYYLIDDEATAADINQKVYNFSYPVQ